MPSVLNFGSLNLDYVYGVDHFVMAGETEASTGREIFAGGKGLNQSIAFAKAGCKTYHTGCIGAEDGALLIKALEEAGVDTSNVNRLKDVPSGHTIIQVDKSGQNCILLFGGANQSQSREHINAVLNKFAAGDLLVLQNEINELEFIMRTAAEKGLKIAFNVSPFSPELLKLPLELCTYLLVNEVEAAGIAGMPAESSKEQLLAGLMQILPKVNIVLTLGSRGSVYKAAGAEALFQDIFKVEAVDTTASGDTYTGFMLGSLLQGKEPQEAMRIGACAAAIAVTRKGAGPSIPTLAEVLTSKLFNS